MNGFADRGKLCVDLVVGKAEHLQTVLGERPAARGVMPAAFLGVVLGTVDLNDQLGAGAVEIHDEGVDNPLLVDFDRIFSKEQLPQFALLRRHIAPKSPRAGKQVVVFGWFHGCHLRFFGPLCPLSQLR